MKTKVMIDFRGQQYVQEKLQRGNIVIKHNYDVYRALWTMCYEEYLKVQSGKSIWFRESGRIVYKIIYLNQLI